MCIIYSDIPSDILSGILSGIAKGFGSVPSWRGCCELRVRGSHKERGRSSEGVREGVAPSLKSRDPHLAGKTKTSSHS